MQESSIKTKGLNIEKKLFVILNSCCVDPVFDNQVQMLTSRSKMFSCGILSIYLPWYSCVIHPVKLSTCKPTQWYQLSNVNMDTSIVFCQDRSAFDQALHCINIINKRGKYLLN